MLRILLLLFPLYSYAIQIETLPKSPSSDMYGYEFIDIDATDIPVEELSKYHLPNTFAPFINDAGEVFYNQRGRCCIKSCRFKSVSPRMILPAECHGVDATDSLLLSSQGSQGAVWNVWRLCHLKVKQKMAIDEKEFLGRNIYLRAFSNGMAAGCIRPSGAFRPVIWTAKQGLNHLGHYLGWDIEGIAWDVNSRGSVAGHLLEVGEQTPFVWNEKWGLQRLSDFASRWERLRGCPLEGHVHFVDALMGEDNLYYGSFYMECHGSAISPRYAFWWDPCSDELRALNLHGMHLNAISAERTFVGEWDGTAALCDIGRRPIRLEELAHVPPGWELLAASDINAEGDMVGYGRKDGKPRYFALKRRGLKKHTLSQYLEGDR